MCIPKHYVKPIPSPRQLSPAYPADMAGWGELYLGASRAGRLSVRLQAVLLTHHAQLPGWAAAVLPTPAGTLASVSAACDTPAACDGLPSLPPTLQAPPQRAATSPPASSSPPTPPPCSS